MSPTRLPALLFLTLLPACTGGVPFKDGLGVDTGPDDTTKEVLECEVAIVGGGAGGLHTAFRLAPDLGDGVCLFEKEAELLSGQIDVEAIAS